MPLLPTRTTSTAKQQPKTAHIGVSSTTVGRKGRGKPKKGEEELPKSPKENVLPRKEKGDYHVREDGRCFVRTIIDQLVRQ